MLASMLKTLGALAAFAVAKLPANNSPR